MRAVELVAPKFHAWNRQRKAVWLTQFARERRVRTALVVGCTYSGTSWDNLVEHALASAVEYICWSSLEPSNGPGHVQADGLCLPFRDSAFDLVFSNAVIEHVGTRAEQDQFVQEHKRVGRTWVITTPNRWFPVESHTRTLLMHYSPSWRARQTTFSRLLSRREFGALTEATLMGSWSSPTLIAWGPGDDCRPPA